MTANKRKKCSRSRGSTTHGGGSMKKRRGAGHRGGRGNAGSGKRCDSRRPSYWKDTKYFGKYGFTSVWADKKEHKVMNLTTLQDKLPTLVSAKKAEEKGGVYQVNLSKLGVLKLLSQGKVTQKLNITVDKASKRAIEKVVEAGGQVQVAQGAQ